MIRFLLIFFFAGLLATCLQSCQFGRRLKIVDAGNYNYGTSIVFEKNHPKTPEFVHMEFVDIQKKKKYFYSISRDSCNQIRKVEKDILSRKKLSDESVLYYFTQQANASIALSLEDSIAIKEIAHLSDSLKWCHSAALTASKGLIKTDQGKNIPVINTSRK